MRQGNLRKQLKRLLTWVLAFSCLPMHQAFAFDSSSTQVATIECRIYAKDQYGYSIEDLNGQSVNIVFSNADNTYQTTGTFSGEQGFGLSYIYAVEEGTYSITISDQISGYDVRIIEEYGSEEISEITIEGNEICVVEIYYTQPATTSVYGSVVWDDANDQDGLRPESVIVSLLEEEEQKGTANITADDAWSFEFSNLLRYDNEDNEIQYTVKSDVVAGYTTAVTGSIGEGFTITYSHTPEDEATGAETPPTVTNGSVTLTDAEKSKDISVYGRYTEYEKSASIISVDVKWDSMNFIYAAKQQGVWDPATHQYKDTVDEKSWVNDKSNITVTNHSNVDVKASFEFDPKTSDSSVTGKFECNNTEKNSVELTAGEEGEPESADCKTVQFVIGGSLSDGVAPSTQIGTITVLVEEKK